MVLVFITALILALAVGPKTQYQKCLENPLYCTTNSEVHFPPTHSYGVSWFNPLVSTPLGLISGLTWKSRLGKMYFAFLGIAYAEIPFRFEPSRPTQPWKGILDATRLRPMCLQMDRMTKSILGAEHCLFLNVYTPKIAPSQLMPVMVWIHGESWMRGGGDQYNPNHFMDHSIVLITLNYRLNAFGFLSTEDDIVQGNMGLKDQINALLWVKQNIQSFGGDPNKITVFGNEAGAASAHLHTLSPLAQGLFHRAIYQSGSALCPWVVQENPLKKAKMLAGLLNCDTSSNQIMISCLRSKSDRAIIEAQQQFGLPLFPSLEPMLIFGPVVEKTPKRFYPYLPDYPHNLIRDGNIMRVPFIIGFTEDEGRFYAASVMMDHVTTTEANVNWNLVAPVSFLYNETISLPDQSSKDGVSSNIRSFYMKGKPISLPTMENYSNIYSDRLYKSCIMETVKMHAGMNAVYPYIFKFRGDFSYSYRIHQWNNDKNNQAPSHYDELHYLFNWRGSPEVQPSLPSYEFVTKLTNLWVSFATTGYPIATWGTTPTWKTASAMDSNIEWYSLDYDTNLMMLTNSEVDRIKFWKSFANPV